MEAAAEPVSVLVRRGGARGGGGAGGATDAGVDTGTDAAIGADTGTFSDCCVTEDEATTEVVGSSPRLALTPCTEGGGTSGEAVPLFCSFATRSATERRRGGGGADAGGLLGVISSILPMVIDDLKFGLLP